MRRVCQRVIPKTCAHAGTPYHAGRALFLALQPRSITTTTSKRKDDDDGGIRWFEQTGKSRSTIKPTNIDDEKDLEALEKTYGELEDIDDQLVELGLGRKDVGLDDFENEGVLSPAMREDLQTLGDDDVVDMHSLDVHYQMPQLMKRHIQRFNAALQSSATQPHNLSSRRELWATYLRCTYMPGFLDQVTKQAWKVLWRSQSGQPFFNEQANHLLRLADDMHKVGLPLSPTQNVTRIKALEAAGQIDRALTQWHLSRSELGGDGNVKHEFLALGVTLECASGRPQKAQDLALDIIQSQTRNRSAVRLLLPVIAEWAKKGTAEDLKRAWLLYLLIRRTLGQAQSAKDSISIEDFDQVYLGFLNAGRKDLAVNVFKDLIVSGRQSAHDSLRLYDSYNKVLDDLHTGAKSSDQVNEISLDILSKLPRSFENKFFYASWMKRLIGLGRVDEAVLVMELMYERGVRPDAKHVNGIIGAWLRNGTPENQKFALGLAWTMMDERLKMIARRHQTQQSMNSKEQDCPTKFRLPVHLQRSVPAATTETLCLLLLYYSQSNLPTEMDQVKRLLTEAEFRPNSYFMNHIMYYYCNQGKGVESWEIFNDMSRQVRPDLTTYTCLWDCAHGLTRRYEQMDKFPAPRRLFSTFMNWYSQLPPNAKESAQEDFSPALYDRIVQVFAHFKDSKGLLIALYAMRDSFGIYPSDDTIQSVTIQVAQMSDRRPAGHPQGRSRVRRRKAAGIDLQRNAEKAKKVFEMILENRIAKLEQQQIKLDGLTAEGRGEESLFTLAEFLRAAERRSIEPDDLMDGSVSLSEEVDRVAWEMGAGPFRMGPPVYGAGHDQV